MRRTRPRRAALRALPAGLLLGAYSLAAPAQSAVAAPAANPAAAPAINPAASAPAEADEPQSFPPFTRQTVTGHLFDSSARNGRPLLIVFWASWCLACIEEAPALRRLKTQYGDRLVMTGIAAREGETEADVRSRAQALRFNYPVIYDQDDSLRAGFNIKLIPQLLLIGGDGRFLLRTMDLDTLRRKLAELLPPSRRPARRPLPQSVHAKIRAPTPRS
jgi:thiol-disulfide isomerase/thioredoxin